jgi:hypothetical protein
MQDHRAILQPASGKLASLLVECREKEQGIDMSPDDVERRLRGLRPSEVRLLSLLCEGLVIKEIAAKMSYSEAWVYLHLAVIYDCFDLPTGTSVSERRLFLGQHVCPLIPRGIPEVDAEPTGAPDGAPLAPTSRALALVESDVERGLLPLPLTLAARPSKAQERALVPIGDSYMNRDANVGRRALLAGLAGGLIGGAASGVVVTLLQTALSAPRTDTATPAASSRATTVVTPTSTPAAAAAATPTALLPSPTVKPAGATEATKPAVPAVGTAVQVAAQAGHLSVHKIGAEARVLDFTMKVLDVVKGSKNLSVKVQLTNNTTKGITLETNNDDFMAKDSVGNILQAQSVAFGNQPFEKRMVPPGGMQEETLMFAMGKNLNGLKLFYSPNRGEDAAVVALDDEALGNPWPIPPGMENALPYVKGAVYKVGDTVNQSGAVVKLIRAGIHDRQIVGQATFYNGTPTAVSNLYWGQPFFTFKNNKENTKFLGSTWIRYTNLHPGDALTIELTGMLTEKDDDPLPEELVLYSIGRLTKEPIPFVVKMGSG